MAKGTAKDRETKPEKTKNCKTEDESRSVLFLLWVQEAQVYFWRQPWAEKRRTVVTESIKSQEALL